MVREVTQRIIRALAVRWSVRRREKFTAGEAEIARYAVRPRLSGGEDEAIARLLASRILSQILSHFNQPADRWASLPKSVSV